MPTRQTGAFQKMPTLRVVVQLPRPKAVFGVSVLGLASPFSTGSGVTGSCFIGSVKVQPGTFGTPTNPEDGAIDPFEVIDRLKREALQEAAEAVSEVQAPEWSSLGQGAEQKKVQWQQQEAQRLGVGAGEDLRGASATSSSSSGGLEPRRLRLGPSTSTQSHSLLQGGVWGVSTPSPSPFFTPERLLDPNLPFVPTFAGGLPGGYTTKQLFAEHAQKLQSLVPREQGHGNGKSQHNEHGQQPEPDSMIECSPGSTGGRTGSRESSSSSSGASFASALSTGGSGRETSGGGFLLRTQGVRNVHRPSRMISDGC